ncbi:aminotransferase class IV [Ancylomarina longa]|uniref:branched-chain-amino-acid transaminase n=1 Tax=Ancylomarina longa TaxID=2487017 RepID=A0A434AFT1_9BACT|nr:aminotransferase class IV [Ancylomarina longa]RUT73243.1 hypothetical protein DLK05_14285 [Ancylomarina longa]
MPSIKYIYYNGNLYPSDTSLWGAENRAFRYGDSLFETIHANGTDIQFLYEHLNRLMNGMQIIGMLIPNDFKSTIEKNINYLIQKNKAFSGTRIRLSVFRNDGGFYTPTKNTVSYLIETSPLDNPYYQINRKGLKIGIYEAIKKSPSIISSFKTGNALPFIMAANYKTKMNWDDCLLLNDRGNLVESISSNLFLVKDNILMTPSLESGSVAGIMREKVIETAIDLKLTIYDDCLIKPKQLLEADEIFLTNSISGIRWIVAFNERRYFNKTSKLLVDRLNQNTFEFPPQ